MNNFVFKFRRNVFFGVLVFLLPALLVSAVVVMADNQKKQPVITLCEIGKGVDVALLTLFDGSISMVSQTDKDGNYSFEPNRFWRGQYPLWLMDANFEEKGKLARYQVIRPDLQFAKVPIGGQAALNAYMDALNGGADEETLAVLAEDTQSWWPCWEMVRVPPSSVVFTDEMEMEDVILYGEARLPVMDVAGDVWTPANVHMNAGPFRQTAVIVDGGGDILYREPVSDTVPITMSVGVTTSGTIDFQSHSRYVTSSCNAPDRAEGLKLERWGQNSCGDEWVEVIASDVPLAIDTGRAVVTGTATITPTIDPAVWPVRSVTCQLLKVSASAMYCTASGDGELVTVTVYDSAFAVAAVPVEVSWVSVSEK